MTTFDPEATIERAEMHIYDKVEDANWGNAYDAARAALPTIAADVLAPIESQRAEWVEMMRDPDMTEIERSAVRMCADELAQVIADIKAKAGVR